MAIEIGRDEGAFSHDLAPLRPHIGQRAPDQPAAMAPSLQRFGHFGMGKDDRGAARPLGGDAQCAIRLQFIAAGDDVVADAVWARHR